MRIPQVLPHALLFSLLFSYRCFTQPKGTEKFARNANGISTVRGASRSSYTLATSANGNHGNFDTVAGGRTGKAPPIFTFNLKSRYVQHQMIE